MWCLDRTGGTKHVFWPPEGAWGGGGGRRVDSIPNTGESLLRILACIVLLMHCILLHTRMHSIALLHTCWLAGQALAQTHSLPLLFAIKHWMLHLIRAAGTFPEISHWMKFWGKTTNKQCLGQTWWPLMQTFWFKMALVVNMMVIVMGGQCTGSCAAAVSRLTHRLLGKSTELLVLVVAF